MSYPSRRRRQNQPYLLPRLLIIGFIGLVLAAFIAVGALFLYQSSYGYRIYPGVRVAGLDLGGMEPTEAAVAIAQKVNYPLLGQITINGPQGKQWVLPPAHLGVSLDPAATANAAFSYGRQGGYAQRLSDQWKSYTQGVDLSPVYFFEQQRAKEALQALARDVERKQVEPSLSLEGTQVKVVQGQNGRIVNLDKTLIDLQQLLPAQSNASIALAIDETKPLLVDVTTQAEKAKSILSQPLTIQLPVGQTDQGPWTIDQQTLAKMLTFGYAKNAEGKMDYVINMQREELVRFLASIAPKLQRYAADPRFIFNDDTRQLELSKPGVIGRALNVDRSLEAINNVLMEGKHTAELQFDLTEPRVKDNASGESLGIKENIHIEYSYFYGSAAERVQNITAAAANFHGLLIAPGETFSMANAMSDITLDNGYAEAPIIVGGRTIEGIGGGVCQVSTTLFRAVFNTGFPIVERHAHAYRVGYYEQLSGPRWSATLAGLDATVFVPIVDFKFTNDTPYWLLMETYVHPEQFNIMWKFYSTGDGRSVEWHTTGPVNTVEAPRPAYEENKDLPSGTVKQVDWAAEGAEVTVKRTVTRGGTTIIEDTFYTKYEPWRAVYQYGPGTEGMPPAPESKPE